MKNFTSPDNFVGIYDGWNNGHKAQLSISQQPNDRAFPLFKIALIELESKIAFTGVHSHQNTQSGHQHRLEDIKLKKADSDEQKHYKCLLLHTGNIDYITGIDVVNGQELGAIFERTREGE